MTFLMIRRTERVQCVAVFLWSIFVRGSGAFFKRVVISFRSENPRKTSVPPCERWIIDEGLWSTEGHNSFNPLWVTAASANTLLLGGPWCMYTGYRWDEENSGENRGMGKVMEAMGCVTSWYGFWSTPAEGIASVQKDRRPFWLKILLLW